MEFCDELIGFIFKISGQTPFDMSRLYQIDPYDDVQIPQKDLMQIADICDYILGSALLENYKDPDEGRKMLQDLLGIIRKAESKGLGLVSIGD